MKLLRLRLKNINCFQKKIELDFENGPLSEASLFAITGPTGSGKTTLLDALCVALYNKTPRLDGTGNKHPRNLLNQNYDEGFSEVLFEVDGKRYLAEWSIKRRKKTLTPSAKLIDADSGDLIARRLTSKKGAPSVEESVTEILNLDFKAFNRSIMLAQGQFSAFLKATPENKREILEATTGIDIYEQLKNALNDKTKDVETKYDGAKAVLESREPISEKDVLAVDEQIRRLQEKLDRFEQDRDGVAKLERKEDERTKVHGKLVQSQDDRNKLLGRKDKIDRLEAEIRSARRAADIRPQRDIYEKDRVSLDKADADWKKAELSSKNARAEHEKAQVDFIKANDDYDNIRKDSERKKSAINAAKNLEAEAKVYLSQAEKVADELSTLNEQIDQLDEALDEESDELTRLDDKIREDESFIDERPLPENSEGLFKDVSTVVANLDNARKNAEGKSAERKKKTSRRNKLQAQLLRLKTDLVKSERQYEETENVCEKAKVALEHLTEKGSEEHWEDQKQVAQSLQDCAVVYEKAVDDLEENRSRQKQIRTDLEELENKYDKVSSDFESLAKDVEIAEEKVKRCVAEEKYALIENKVAVLRKEHLKEGEPCPVCGSIEHPYVDREEADAEKLMAVAQENLSNAQSELESLRKQSVKLDREKARLEAKKVELANEIEQCSAKTTEIESDKTEAEEEWRRSYPNKRDETGKTLSIPSISYLKSQIAETEDYLKRIISAKQSRQDAESEKRFLAQRLESARKELDGIKQQVSELDEELETVNGEISALEQELEQLKSKFWKLMPSHISDYKLATLDAPGLTDYDSIAIAFGKLEMCILEVNKRKERLVANRLKRERLQTSIEGSRKLLAGEKRRTENLESQENQHRQKGDALLAEARQKTGGLKPEVALKRLNAELERCEAKRNEVQEKLQSKRDELTQAENSLDNAEKRFDEVHGRFDETKKRYFDALAQAGFDSPGEHQNFLRNPKWIEQNVKIVENYRKELHSVEGRIAELESSFENEPYAPDKLDRILVELKSIDDAIKDQVDKRGKLSEKKSELQKELILRRKLEKKLVDVQKEYDRWMKLKECIPANKLRDFALKSMFDLLVRYANSKLEELTGRYTLRAEGMKNMVVLDRWNAGEERPVETLSGGETFLTSLSLALALSELSQGRTKLNSLFLDEGFGTLDSETLDVALATLEALQLSGRTIGVISHVRDLTRRIPTRIAVRKLGDGSSDLQLKGVKG